MSLWDLWLDNMRQAQHWRDTARHYLQLANIWRGLGQSTYAGNCDTVARQALDHARRQVRFAKQNRLVVIQFQRWP